MLRRSLQLAASHAQFSKAVYRQSVVSIPRQVSLLDYQVRTFGPKKGNQSNKEKKEQEKAQVHTEFEGKQIDDVKKEYADSLLECKDSLDEELAAIKSGRASTKIFDDLEVKAYGEPTPFVDVA